MMCEVKMARSVVSNVLVSLSWTHLISRIHKLGCENNYNFLVFEKCSNLIKFPQPKRLKQVLQTTMYSQKRRSKNSLRLSTFFKNI